MAVTAFWTAVAALLPALVSAKCPHLDGLRRALSLPQGFLTPDKLPAGFPGKQGYVKCAREHTKGMDNLCYCEGQVIYGNRHGFTAPKQLRGCVECHNNEFPGSGKIPGAKQCFCKAPKPLGLPDGIKYDSCRPWITVGKEWEEVTCDGEVSGRVCVGEVS